MSEQRPTLSMPGTGLAQLKPEGTVQVYDRSHELSGVQFTAFKDCCQHYSGEAVVIRQLKSGMMLCISIDGETEFRETLTKVRRGIPIVARETSEGDQ